MSVKFQPLVGDSHIILSEYLWKEFLNSSGPLPYWHHEYGPGYIVDAF